jgi:hypothetical protein
MSSILLVRLKIPDLTALTALDAGRRLLPPGHALDRLVREEVYLFEPEAGQGLASAAAAFEPALAEAVETSNFFVNPNKERYQLLTSSERGGTWVPPEGSWGLLTRARGDTRDQGLRERLLREHPLRGLGAIRRGRVWWLWTRAPQGDAGVEVSCEALGPVEHAGRGLLVNPHSESWMLLAGPTEWTRIETFLAEPAGAPAAATA